MMEIYNRFIDKVITVLGSNGYTEGSYTDLNVHRFIQLYCHPQNKVLEDHCTEGTTGELIITEPTGISDADMVPKLTSLVI